MCSGTSGSNFQLLSTSWRYLYCTLHKYCTTIKGNLHLCKLGTLQTCCLFQQCSLLHIVSAIDWGHMCFDSPHTSTLDHSRHTYCNTNVSVSDFCKLIFQILKCVLSVCIGRMLHNDSTPHNASWQCLNTDKQKSTSPPPYIRNICLVCLHRKIIT